MLLPEKIITLRKREGLSQADLADKLGISRQAVCKWENGESAPDIANLKLLSVIFNVSLDILLNDKAEPRGRTKKPAFGPVVSTKISPNFIDPEKVNTKRSPLEEKHLKIRKVTMISLLVAGILFTVAMIVLFTVGFLTDGDIDVFFPLILISLVLAVFSFCGWYLCDRFLYTFDLIGMREHFFALKEKEEEALRAKEYKFFLLQEDLPVWFFTDPKARAFGFWLLGEEQLLCPFQNFGAFEYNITDESYHFAERKMNGGVILGANPSYVVSSHTEDITIPNCVFHCKLTYYKEDGTLAEYRFKLKSMRNYQLIGLRGENGYMTSQNAKFTRDALQKIKTTLELERAGSNA